MFSRSELKTLAKDELRNSYWLSFAVMIVVSILSMWTPIYNYLKDHIVVNLFVINLVVQLLNIFIANPTFVGMKNFFLSAANGRRDFSVLFSAFKNKQYFNTVITMFLYYLFIGLWSLLFVIPGIIKSYEYKMIPYLISENPEMTFREAKEMSAGMTYGYKMDMFVLDLSFIGWYFLAALISVLTLGLGSVLTAFIRPYPEATYAQLYIFLKIGQKQN